MIHNFALSIGAIGAVVLASAMALSFPEDQTIPGPFQITPQWQTIEFDKPLKIDRSGTQGLALVVSTDGYLVNSELEWNNPEVGFAFWREDGTPVQPEVALIGDEGERVELAPAMRFGKRGREIGISYGMMPTDEMTLPDYPETIHAFQAVEIRSDHPVTVKRLEWSMERHPSMFGAAGS